MKRLPCNDENSLLACQGFEEHSQYCDFCPREWLKRGIKPKGWSKQEYKDFMEGKLRFIK